MHDGNHTLWIRNNGTETIPPTFYITIVWPDGSTFLYIVDIPLEPGNALGADASRRSTPSSPSSAAPSCP